ncbi:cytochrome P450 78A7-like [Hibiscus syriacus]|uniref:Cytochrome P450 78A7-like n=1 Tax=Hibiscus syriacus TaxID=106335 RepID=A0A6A2Y242_HIBSY|nr:cytochrome P450 78A7-like [Hibiscus syriacus]
MRSHKRSDGDSRCRGKETRELEGYRGLVRVKGQQTLVNSMAETTDEYTRGLESMYLAMRAEIMREVKELKSELLVYKAAVLNGVTGEAQAPRPRIDVPKPKEYKGSRNAQDVFREYKSNRNVGRVCGRTQGAFLSEKCCARGSSKTKAIEVRSFHLGVCQKLHGDQDANPGLGRVRRVLCIHGWSTTLGNKEIQRRGVTELSKALDAAEAIALFEVKKADSLQSKPKLKGNSRGEKAKGSFHKPTGGNGRQHDQPKKLTNPWEKKGELSCFNCGGNHMKRDCPQLVKVAAIKENDGVESETLKLGSILSTMEVKKGRKKKGLMYVDITVACKKMSALGIELTIRGWSGKEAIKVIPLDDFDFVLGLSFLDRINAFPVPFADCLCILDPKKQCIIPVSRGPRIEAKMLSAIEFSKAVCKEEPNFLVALVCDEPITTKEVPAKVSHVLAEFKDVMPAELPKKLPPKREVDHKIELVKNAKPTTRAPYQMAPPELEKMRKQLKDLLDAGYIRPSKSPYGVLMLFQKKHDGSLRMCIDYRALKKLTVKNKYPIPLIADLFDQFGGARWFTKLDLRSDYYQVRIAEGDEPKTACVTRYGSYEYLVMPFGLTNAPTTFCTLMNKVLQPFLDHFVVVYLDDIVVYSNTLEEHIEHLRRVFQVLRENELYVKEENCSFAQKEVPFLGHVVGGGKLQMDKDKIRAIDEWNPPTKVTKLRVFLGLTNYYRRFVKGYSKIATLLTELLKKDKVWEWSTKCQGAFEKIKEAMVSEPVLVLPDYTKPFVVFTDASDVAIGGVLIYFFTQKKLSPKQARWQEFLAEFYFSLEYKPGKVNCVVDGLNRRYAIETVEGTLLKRIKEGLPHDLLRKELMKKCHDSKWAGHPGVDRTLALLSEQYYWPHMAEDVQAYMKTCLVCQFSKYVTFIPASKVCPAVEAARLFLKHVVKYWGMPKTIISDRDTRFTGRFWTELFKLMGSSLNFSTAVHPQTDGQTKRVNALLEIHLRHYVSSNQRDWPKLLDVAQFSYNLQQSEATNKSPFEIVTGQQPLTPNTVVTKYDGPNPSAHNVSKEWHEQHDLARACLHKVGKQTKKWADRKRRDVNFEVGDLVLAKLANVLHHADVHKGLVRRYEGLFRVVKRVGTMAYKLELPPTIRAYHVIHVSLLKSYHQDIEDPDRGKSQRAPVGVAVSYDKEIQDIQAERVIRRPGHRPRHEYFVLWKGQPECEGSWEHAEGLWQFKTRIDQFHARRVTRASPE